MIFETKRVDETIWRDCVKREEPGCTSVPQRMGMKEE
jgi:hypothetical protein